MTATLLTALTAQAEAQWHRYCDALPGGRRASALPLSDAQWTAAAERWRTRYNRTMRAVRYLTLDRLPRV